MQKKAYHKNNFLQTSGMPLERRARQGMVDRKGWINAMEICLIANSKTFIATTLGLPQSADKQVLNDMRQQPRR
jgi:hypothetical protein